MRITLTLLAVLLVSAALGAACATGGAPTLPTPVLPTGTIAAPTRASTPLAPAGTATGTATPTRPAGSPTVQPSATLTGTPDSRPGRLSANDVIRLLTAAKTPATQTGQTVACGNGAASTGQVWQASAQGAQQQFVLWQYPDHASLENDWVADIGKAPVPRREGCVSGGSGYWNENLVLYIQGRDIGALTTAIRDAFLSVGP